MSLRRAIFGPTREERQYEGEMRLALAILRLTETVAVAAVESLAVKAAPEKEKAHE